MRNLKTKICKLCSKIFLQNYTCSDKSWLKTDFCGRQCCDRFKIGTKRLITSIIKQKRSLDKTILKRGVLSFDYFKIRVRIRDNYTCVVCGLYDKLIVQVDHIIPLKRGGINEFSNLRTICPNCHMRKTLLQKENRKLKHA